MRGPGLLLVALVAGVLAGERLGASPAVPALAVSAVVLASAGLRARAGGVRLALAVLGVALLGCALMQRALSGIERSPLTAPARGREDVRVRFTLSGDPVPGTRSGRGRARAGSFDPGDGRGVRSAGGRTIVVHASGEAAMRLAVLSSGDRVLADGWLRPLVGFDGRDRWRHAVARLEATDVLGVAPPRAPPSRLANSLREVVLRGTRVLPSTERALLGGFLLGDTRAVPRPVIDAFRDAGLSHLLAVSGANVAFALALAGPLLRRAPLALRAAGGLAVIGLFGTMTRWEPSVLRASVMAGLALLAVWAGRPGQGPRVLALAALVLVAVDPFLVHSVGFLLSLGASAGIVLGAPTIARHLRGPRAVREVLAVPLGAQIGVLPVMIPVFGSVPLASLPANLVAVPVAEPLSIWGTVAGVVGGAAGPAGARVLQVPSLGMLRWIEGVAHTAAGVGVGLDGRALWGGAALGALIAAGRRSRRRSRAIVGPGR